MDNAIIEWGDLPSRRVMLHRIERMDLSADAKAVTVRLMDLTLEVGGRIVELGKAVLTFVLDVIERFPHLTFGVAVALIVSFLIAAVPVVGPPLSALMTPILVAFRLGMGALEDMWSGALRKNFQSFGQDVEIAVAGSR